MPAGWPADGSAHAPDDERERAADEDPEDEAGGVDHGGMFAGRMATGYWTGDLARTGDPAAQQAAAPYTSAMWQAAYRGVARCVFTVMRERYDGEGKRWMHSTGSAFLIGRNPLPTLLTCAHVVADTNHNVYPGLWLFGLAEPRQAAISGLRVEHIVPHLDLAIVVSGFELPDVQPTFDMSTAQPGEPMAAVGYPSQPRAERHLTGGEQRIIRRLATGYVSGSDVPFKVPTVPYTDPALAHYELNMFAYPGISGAPLFDLAGRIRGIVRGTACYRRQVAAYAYAVRTAELVDALRSKAVPAWVLARS